MKISDIGRAIAAITPTLASNVRTHHACLKYKKFTPQMYSDLFELCEHLLEESFRWHKQEMEVLSNKEGIQFMTGKMHSIREYLT